MLLFDRFDMVCCMVLMMSCYSYAFVFLLVVVVPVAPSVYVLCKWMFVKVRRLMFLLLKVS